MFSGKEHKQAKTFHLFQSSYTHPVWEETEVRRAFWTLMSKCIFDNKWWFKADLSIGIEKNSVSF